MQHYLMIELIEEACTNTLSNDGANQWGVGSQLIHYLMMKLTEEDYFPTD